MKNHKFFGNLNWENLRQRKIKSPWKPHIKNPLDTGNFDTYDENEEFAPYVDDGSNWDADF